MTISLFLSMFSFLPIQFLMKIEVKFEQNSENSNSTPQSCANLNAIKETFQSWHHVTQIYFAGNHKIFFLLF